MKSSIAAFLSYLFIAAIVVLIISAFGAVIIGIRHILTTISETEKSIGIKFLITFVCSGVLAPVILYLNLKLDRLDKIHEDI